MAEESERSPEGTEQSPVYRKVEEGKGGATRTFMIVCNEGWRESIVCNGMYEWAADWLVELIQGKPYADGPRMESIRRNHG